METFEKQFILPELVNSGIFANDRYVNFHSHPGTELVLLTQGHCKMEVDKYVLEADAETLFILPADKEHSQINNGFVRTIYLSFRRNALFNETPRVIAGDRWIKTWMKHIYSMHNRVHDDFTEPISGLLYSILKRIAQIEHKKSENKMHHPAILVTLEYIETHLNSPINIEEMAKHAGISASYLCALFNKEFSKGPVTIALESKLKYAERLLREPYFSVKEIALACGFEDPNYFSRFFHKCRGLSPTEYRDSL
jgi:AraC-like DNA-binding protein